MTNFSIVLTLALAVLASRLAVELKRLGALPAEDQTNHIIVNLSHAPGSVTATNSLTGRH